MKKSEVTRLDIAEYLDSKEIIPASVNSQMMSYFRLYTAIGGMPEAVQKYIDTKDFREVDTVAPRIGNERGAGLADMAKAIAEGRKPRVSADLCRHVTEAINAFNVCVETGLPYRMTTCFDRPAAMEW